MIAGGIAMWSVDPTLDLLSKAVEVAALRHAVHASNIANADIAGYQPLQVTFSPEQSVTSGAMGLSGEGVVKASHETPRIVASADSVVKLDQEIAQMSQNALRYQALLGAFERTVDVLRTAARDGRSG
jgi:flagellar basal-body rod protein FlgB